MTDDRDDLFGRWLTSLEERHLAELRFPEVSRALRALSSTYVQRRNRIGEGAALSGAGKRAAFALFYGPLHFLMVRHIVTSLGAAAAGCDSLIDLGCGTGASGAAWAGAWRRAPSVLGIDRHPWAVKETMETYDAFELNGRARIADVTRVTFPDRSAVLAAFAVNEVENTGRDVLLRRLVAHSTHGGCVLIVEPIAGFVAPWWTDWRGAVESGGGRADEWRVSVTLPPLVQKLDRAAGLNHRELTARSLWLPPA